MARRRKLLNTFDREPNKPIDARTVLAAVRRERLYGACKFGVARVLRARPNSRTFDAVQRLLEQLLADGRIEISTMCNGTTYYQPKGRR